MALCSSAHAFHLQRESTRVARREAQPHRADTPAGPGPQAPGSPTVQFVALIDTLRLSCSGVARTGMTVSAVLSSTPCNPTPDLAIGRTW